MVEKQLTLLASAMQASVGGDRARLEDVLNESTTVIVRCIRAMLRNPVIRLICFPFDAASHQTARGGTSRSV
jgi:hypothetical protein